jgi:chemosensory pili system protein ChpA (sensor histidine kinase/response regulator)
MQPIPAGSAPSDSGLAAQDLGPLAWVLDELRKSLDGAVKSLKRFSREADAARGTALGTLDSAPLRMARQQIHQTVGALEMVGLSAPAQVLRAMESVVQKFVDRPELCNEAAAAKVERCSFALAEYLESVLGGKPVSAVSLFPQYRDVQELGGADRIHPADLWAFEWRWIEPASLAGVAPLDYGTAVRGRIDQAVLKLFKSGNPVAAKDLCEICLGLAGAQTGRQPRTFWRIAAGYFDALSGGLVPVDVYVKRAISRVLLQYSTLARGDDGISDRLTQDLLFFCAQAEPAQAGKSPALEAVRSAYSLARFKPIDYEASPFGRFDPAVLAQARKRIESAKETWSMLSGGDASKLKAAGDQFNAVGDSLARLHPPSAPLSQALVRSVDAALRSGKPPSTELAMEVATSVLYLEAAFEDLDPTDPQLGVRTGRLAERLDRVTRGGQPEPLEPWMEELYRRVSDRQTMGTVVGELRSSLSELEKSLDQFFRNPKDSSVLAEVPSQLAQMRGVLSVLGLDQASQSVLRMRDGIEELLVTEVDEDRARAAGTFDKLGNNLGALGFLIDMLGYQPALAKKLFVFDEEKGELRPLMGRSVAPDDHSTEPATAPELLTQEIRQVVDAVDHGQGGADLSAKLGLLASQAALADQPELARTAREAAKAMASDDAGAAANAMSQLAAISAPSPVVTLPEPVDSDIEEDDLRDIFLEEAREVVQNGAIALDTLKNNPTDLEQQTTLRRAFHTLKGSSRMVGLNEFGEAAWAFEQLLNTWLADQKPVTADLHGLSGEALLGMSQWVDDIANGTDAAWQAAPFRAAAEAFSLDGRVVPIILPAEHAFGGSEPIDFTATRPVMHEVEPEASALPELSSDADFDFDLDLAAPVTPPPADAPAPDPVLTEAAAADISDLDFDSLFAANEPSVAAAAPLAEPVVEPSLPSAPDWDFTASPNVPAGAPEPLVDLTPGLEADALPPLPEPQMEPVAHAMEPETDEPLPVEDPVKVIESLRIGLPLYNVYLNEADEWSRRLLTELNEWALEVHQPVPPGPSSLAHSLAGSSATVGFTALSGLSRELEHALQHIELQPRGTAAQARVCLDAAEDIRRLLHQFAAGFLKEPNPLVLEAVRHLQSAESVEDAAPAEPQPAESPRDMPPLRMVTQDGVVVDEAFTAAPMDLAPPVEPVPVQEPVFEQNQPLVGTSWSSSATNFIAPAAVIVNRLVEPEEADDDIDAIDAVDPDLFPIFEEEAAELLPQLGGALRQWSARPGNDGARIEVLRALHTLKGSARLAGALRLGEVAHRMESEIEQLGRDDLQTAQIEPLLGRFDGLQAVFDQLRHGSPAEAPVDTPEAEPAALQTLATAEVTAPAPLADIPPLADISPVEAKIPDAVRTALALPASTVLAPLRQASNQAIRVRAQVLDRLVNQAGEVIITRSRLEAELGQLRGSLGDLTGNLDRLRSQLRDIELQAETQMQSRLAQAKDSQQGFDPLEFDRFTRVQELTRMMAESVNDVATVQRSLQRTVEATEDDLNAQARQTRELQRDLLRTRMVEFESISDRLYRVVRQASKDSGKQVKLDITGGSIEMDRGVLDRMTPAFEHLLRNCVAHGVEDPETRVTAGKDSAGNIVIDLHQEGNDVSVAFRDDGAGLNVQRIRDKAIALGLVTVDRFIGDAEAADLIFMPGFTTASEVTELSGRGIGMDVVRAEVNALGGRIETHFEAGHGTTFKLVLPLTTAVTQVVMVRSGTQSIGVPANLVETVRRTTAKDLQLAYNSGNYAHGNLTIPFFWSGALLQSSQRSDELQGKTLPVVVFRSAAQRVAVHVDEVLGTQEVVVKNLGPQLSRLPGLAGMTVLASGAVVLIYNPVALATVYGVQARALSADHAQPDMLGQPSGALASVVLPAPAQQVPLILVVDDSITVRRVTQRLLQREGYRVSLAADGLQALERLQDELPTVVLSDIEMPRMDGFDLARNIRGDSRLKDLPIIMITSRIAGKHRDHAMELGVNHYLGKPYSEEELLSLVRRYVSAEIEA